jgi:MFS superfamily sulfate permease-like transporter
LVGEFGMEIIPWVAIVSGMMSLAVWGLSLEKYCTLIPNSVLEGFSMGVGITIGCGQLNFAFGLDNKSPSKVFYENVGWSFSNLGDL